MQVDRNCASMNAVMLLVLFTKRKASFMKTLNKSGPRTKPCGTPIVISPTAMCYILDFELSRNQRQGSGFVSREVEFMRWFPVAFLANGVFKSDT